jgi:hypothetical protein
MHLKWGSAPSGAVGRALAAHIHWLMPPGASVFGARARRTATEAGALPVKFNCIVPGKADIPVRRFWLSPVVLPLFQSPVPFGCSVGEQEHRTGKSGEPAGWKACPTCLFQPDPCSRNGALQSNGSGSVLPQFRFRNSGLKRFPPFPFSFPLSLHVFHAILEILLRETAEVFEHRVRVPQFNFLHHCGCGNQTVCRVFVIPRP